MPFTCISCRRETDPSGPSCPYCGEVFTDFLRTYMVQMIDGKYQIIERLGRGGMGEVYKVLHTHLGVTRVIKTMRPRLTDDPKLHERFVREAKLATRIQHPNVAMLYDFSALPDGSFYMVWEYIDGTNLATIIRRRGKLEPKLAIDIAVQALNGLEAIHAAGIIHRDISPENIMVSMAASGALHVKVIDLGIAKSETVDDALTSTGMFVGKWKYASPEQMGLLAEGQVLDGRADLFSFGIVLYEMLAGRAPYEATTPGQYLILQMQAPNPVTVQNLTFPDAPGLEKILERAVEKERDKRYPTARALADVLAALRATLPPSPDDATTIRPAPAGAVSAPESAPARTPTPTPVPTTGPAARPATGVAAPAPASATPPPAAAPPVEPSRLTPIAATAAIDVSALTAGGDGPAAARPPSATGEAARAAVPATKVVARRRTGLIAGAIVLLALLVVAATVLFRGVRNEVPTEPRAATGRADASPPPATPGEVSTPAPQTPAAAPVSTVTEATAIKTTPAPPAPGPAPSPATARPVQAAPSAKPVVAPTAANVPAPSAEATPVSPALPIAPAANPEPAREEAVTRDDRIATAGPLGRRSRALTASNAWKESFPRGIIQAYDDLYSGANVDWAAIGRGVKLSAYKVVLDKLQNRTAYDGARIGTALETDLQKRLDETAGDKGTVHAQIAIVWAAAKDARSPDDIAFEVIFREARGPVVAKLHHRLSARSPEGLAEDVVEAIRDFIEDHPVVQ